MPGDFCELLVNFFLGGFLLKLLRLCCGILVSRMHYVKSELTLVDMVLREKAVRDGDDKR